MSSSPEKTVYLHAIYGEDEVFDEESGWYALKLPKKVVDGENSPMTAIKPIPESTLMSFGNFYAALGSTIYSFSASCVHATDATTLSSGQRWNLLASVTPPERSWSYAEAVAADGKIYVFRPLMVDGTLVGQVFDPCKNTLEPIKSIPYASLFRHPYYGFLSAVYSDTSKRIILCSLDSGVLLAYDVRADSWEVVDTNFPALPISIFVTRAVLFDDTLYWFWGGDKWGGVGLYAYDLALKRMIKAEIKGLHSTLHQGLWYRPVFFHFSGNEFYLIWLDSVGFVTHQHRSTINCTRIQIDKQVDKRRKEFFLTAFASFTQTYLADTTIEFIDGVVLKGTGSGKGVTVDSITDLLDGVALHKSFGTEVGDDDDEEALSDGNYEDSNVVTVGYTRRMKAEIIEACTRAIRESYRHLNLRLDKLEARLDHIQKQSNGR